ncbi:hypothetical protein E2C01_029851 [Portunus trituberculatus]|uniref:Uncharacterized protein n=1 Tax=Portunus trituberculatus TaxID=210409 RepID=A0A5B7EVP0_PORTR|nr:hypothetical protein [Portunus trituberculatus]
MKEREAEASQAQQQQHMLSLKVLSEAVGKLREALDFIEENDPDVRKSSSVSCSVGRFWVLSRDVRKTTKVCPDDNDFILKRKVEEEYQSEEKPRGDG